MKEAGIFAFEGNRVARLKFFHCFDLQCLFLSEIKGTTLKGSILLGHCMAYLGGTVLFCMVELSLPLFFILGLCRKDFFFAAASATIHIPRRGDRERHPLFSCPMGM